MKPLSVTSTVITIHSGSHTAFLCPFRVSCCVIMIKMEGREGAGPGHQCREGAWHMEGVYREDMYETAMGYGLVTPAPEVRKTLGGYHGPLQSLYIITSCHFSPSVSGSLPSHRSRDGHYSKYRIPCSWTFSSMVVRWATWASCVVLSFCCVVLPCLVFLSISWMSKAIEAVV